MVIGTLEGVLRVNWGDYIIQGIKGEIYACKPEIFKATYEKVDSPSPKDWAEVEREFDELFHVRTNSYNEEVGDTGYFKDGMGKQYFKVAEIKSFLRYQLPPCELDEKKIEEIILSVAKEVVQNNVQNTSAAMLGGEQVPQRFLHKEVAQALCLAYKKGEITKEKNEEKQSMDGTKKSENK